VCLPVALQLYPAYLQVGSLPVLNLLCGIYLYGSNHNKQKRDSFYNDLFIQHFIEERMTYLI